MYHYMLSIDMVHHFTLVSDSTSPKRAGAADQALLGGKQTCSYMGITYKSKQVLALGLGVLTNESYVIESEKYLNGFFMLECGNE